MRVRLFLGLLGAALLLALTPGSASAATTFGSNLSSPPDDPVSSAPYTLTNRSFPTGEVAAGGATAPVDGVVVRWRVRTVGGTTSPARPTWNARLRLLRANTSVGRGDATEVNDVSGTQTFATRLPVQAGDALGIDIPGGNGYIVRTPAGGTLDLWSPPLSPGATLAPDFSAAFYATINADIEADADGDGFGDESQDSCPADPAVQVGLCPDRTDPSTTITKAPRNKLTKPKSTVEFSSDEPGATFECALDSPEYKPCTSPLKLTKLKPGKHTFGVRAIDAAGNADGSAAIAKFKAVKRKR